MSKDTEVDGIFRNIGFGRWQLVQYTWLILLYPLWANNFLSIVLIGFIPDFKCIKPEQFFETNQTANIIFDNKCNWLNKTSNQSEPCNHGYVYSEPKHVSLVSEWDLICGKAFLSDLSQTILNVGQFLGSVVFPPIADRYGRRLVVLWTHVGFIIMTLVTAFMPNIWAFLASRILLGAFGSGTGIVGWILLLEMFIPKHRTIAAVFSGIFWAFSVCTVPAFGYLMDGQSWKHLQMIYCVFAIVCIGQFVTIEESIRWLFANGRKQQAVKIVRRACKTNKVKPEVVNEIIMEYFEDGLGEKSCEPNENESPVNGEFQMKMLNNEQKTPSKSSKVSALDILRNPSLRKIAIIIGFAWFTNSLTYSGLYLLSSEMSGSRYLNLFLNAIVEIPSGIILLPLTMKFRRRTICIALHIMAGISLITAAILYVTLEGPLASILQRIVMVLGKFSITSSFMIIFIYTPELYPTNIRSIGTAVADLLCRCGGFISPFSATVSRSVPWAPACVFGTLCLLVSICCIFLPETGDKELPQTLNDLQQLVIQNADHGTHNKKGLKNEN